MNDQDSVNVGTKHSSNERSESPRPALVGGLVGRELDAAVAKRVFAHEIRVFDEPVGMMFAYHRRWVYNGEKYIWWEREGYQPEVYLPHYSTLMVDTILILDQMRDKGFRLGVSPDSRDQCSVCGSEPKSYIVWFEESSGDGASSDSMIAEAETLSEAICRAALAAVAHNQPARDAGTTTIR